MGTGKRVGRLMTTRDMANRPLRARNDGMGHDNDLDEGIVDQHKEHIKLSIGDDPTPMALLAPQDPYRFTVQFLIQDNEVTRASLKAIRTELDFYLIGLGEKDPWAYAKYHCGTASNIYSEVHWGLVAMSPG